MTTTTLAPLAVTIDNSGGYNKFLTTLEKNIGKAKAGEVRFVLHKDEDKELYIQHHDVKGNYELFINPVDVNTLRQSPSEVHHMIGSMLKERAQKNGYYIIWSSADRIHLVPSPTKKTARKSTKGFGA